ncbi:hypothetical protein [Mycolicibacterium cosmeticum]|uniref:Uncharacterized protein n=1 Tax=Mycolicibacterium cosmeticum TaxID=258533 RepID=W9AME8_MYCCO|nr:hypothetical protein [Mycolicibacterium cosmeticum]CDO06899.1 hypothetical protein BN977_01694 [Mycolicibacterium cosmeticum]
MTTELHASTQLQAAAWVPNDDPQRPWEEAIALAAEWIRARSDAEELPPVLVSNSIESATRLGNADLEQIIDTGGHATPRTSTRYDRGPVLAFVPNERSLHFAINLARGYSLALVEGRFPLAEWAAAAGAIDLLTGRTAAPQIPEDVRRDLDFAILDGGRNGWTGPDEKAQARRYLIDHIRAGRLTPDQAAAYTLTSPAVSERGAKRLRELLARNR